MRRHINQADRSEDVLSPLERFRLSRPKEKEVTIQFVSASCFSPDWILEHLTDAIACDLNIPPIHTIEAARNYLERQDNSYAITMANQLIGLCGFFWQSSDSEAISYDLIFIHYWIAEHWQGLRLAKPMIQLLLNYVTGALTSSSLQHAAFIYADVFSDNIRSITLLHHLGFICHSRGQRQSYLIPKANKGQTSRDYLRLCKKIAC